MRTRVPAWDSARLGALRFAQRCERTRVRAENRRRPVGERRSLHRRGQERQERVSSNHRPTTPGRSDPERIKIVSVESTRRFDVTTSRRTALLRQPGRRRPRTLIVRETTGDVSLPTEEVTVITPIGARFWKRLDGSLDLGFSYTRSSEIAQLSLNSSTVYRVPAFEARLNGSATLTQNSTDGVRDDRGTIQTHILHFRGQRLFIGAGGGFESGESLGLIPPVTQLAGFAGAAGELQSGAAVDQRRSVRQRRTKRRRGLHAKPGRASSRSGRRNYAHADRLPARTLDLSLRALPRARSNRGRQRMQSLDASARREIWIGDVSPRHQRVRHVRQPAAPTAGADRNDVGVVLSLGWIANMGLRSFGSVDLAGPHAPLRFSQARGARLGANCDPYLRSGRRGGPTPACFAARCAPKPTAIQPIPRPAAARGPQAPLRLLAGARCAPKPTAIRSPYPARSLAGPPGPAPRARGARPSQLRSG